MFVTFCGIEYANKRVLRSILHDNVTQRIHYLVADRYIHDKSVLTSAFFTVKQVDEDKDTYYRNKQIKEVVTGESSACGFRNHISVRECVALGVPHRFYFKEEGGFGSNLGIYEPSEKAADTAKVAPAISAKGVAVLPTMPTARSSTPRSAGNTVGQSFLVRPK